MLKLELIQKTPANLWGPRAVYCPRSCVLAVGASSGICVVWTVGLETLSSNQYLWKVKLLVGELEKHTGLIPGWETKKLWGHLKKKIIISQIKKAKEEEKNKKWIMKTPPKQLAKWHYVNSYQ